MADGRRDRERVRARLLPDGPSGRAEAVRVLRAGGVVALPTDTVYGIAADPSLPGAVERLFAAKRRPPEKAIGLLVGSVEQAAEAGRFGPAARALADAFWPGGLTIVVRARDGPGTVGLRLPDHPCPRMIAAAVGPLPTTSANLSGEPEAPDGPEVLALLGDAIDLVLDGGPAHGGPASTVVDCSGRLPRVLRAGVITVDRLAAVLDAAAIEHGVGR